MKPRPGSRRDKGYGAKALARRSDVVNLVEWRQQKTQTDLEQRAKDGDAVDRLRANRGLVALRRMLRRVEGEG